MMIGGLVVLALLGGVLMFMRGAAVLEGQSAQKSLRKTAQEGLERQGQGNGTSGNQPPMGKIVFLNRRYPVRPLY